MRNIYLLFIIMLGFSACEKSSDSDVLAAETRANLSYGNDPKMNMDIYLPANRSEQATPLLILVHGGGWYSGDKTDMAPSMDVIKMLMPDWAIANINYRLANFGVNLFPTQEMDVKNAVEYLNNNRGNFKISGNFSMLGVSAGGHLSLLQSYKYAAPVKMKSVVNFFGPSDMEDLYYNPASSMGDTTLLNLLMSGTPMQNPQNYFQSSAVSFINAQTPPTITFQGTEDPLVRLAQQNNLHNKLNQFGVVNQLVIYEGEGHGWGSPNIEDSYAKAVAFLKQYGK